MPSRAAEPMTAPAELSITIGLWTFAVLAVAARGLARETAFVNVTPAAAQPGLARGPILGQVTDAGIRVWGRTSAPAALAFRFGVAANRLDRSSDATNTEAAHDNTGAVELRRLEPDTRYHLRAVVAGRPQGPTASFRTLPSQSRMRDDVHNPRGLFNLKFQFGSCAGGVAKFGSAVP